MESEGGLSTPVMLMLAGGLVFLAHLFQFVFQRFRFPDALWLIGVGLVIGPLAGWVAPEDLGIVGPALTEIALAIILFEAGLELRLKDLKVALGSALLLTFATFSATLLAVMLVMRYLGGMPWVTSVFAGAVLATPAPPVILPMIRDSKLNADLKVTITLESALGEALGLVVALAILNVATRDDVTPGIVVGRLLSSFVVASLLGLGAGVLWAYVLERVRGLKHSMVLTPSVAFISFGLAAYLGFSGPVSVLAFGFVLGNLQEVARQFSWQPVDATPARIEKPEMDFLGELIFLLKTFFFVFLGISIRPADLWSIPALVCIAVALIVRFAMVRVAIPGLIKNSSEGAVTGSLIPKGLAAAVMGAAAAAEPGFPEGEVVDNRIYSVILFSIAITAILVFTFERTSASRILLGWMFKERAGGY